MVYKWYILPIGGLYATYHLLREPKTTIDKGMSRNQSNRWFTRFSRPKKTPCRIHLTKSCEEAGCNSSDASFTSKSSEMAAVPTAEPEGQYILHVFFGMGPWGTTPIWVFPKIWENPPIIHFNRVFHEINHPFWGVSKSPYFWVDMTVI